MKDAIFYNNNKFREDEIIPLIKELKENGVNVVVISTTNQQYPVTVIDGREIPAFEVFLDALKLLKTTPDSCVVYDFTTDNSTRSKDFGFYTIGLSKKCDRIINSPQSNDCRRGLP